MFSKPYPSTRSLRGERERERERERESLMSYWIDVQVLKIHQGANGRWNGAAQLIVVEIPGWIHRNWCLVNHTHQLVPWEERERERERERESLMSYWIDVQVLKIHQGSNGRWNGAAQLIVVEKAYYRQVVHVECLDARLLYRDPRECALFLPWLSMRWLIWYRTHYQVPGESQSMTECYRSDDCRRELWLIQCGIRQL